jgi:hypothetical protein
MIHLILAAAIAAQATVSTEMLGIDAPDEFQVANHQRSDKAEIIELVEPPETVDDWSSLITSLMIFGGAEGGMDGYYSRWLGDMRNACPKLTDDFVHGAVDGHPAIRGTLSCPRNPQTGKPENLGVVLVQGDANLMMAQVAFRRAITPADRALIEHVAGSLKVCDQRTLETCSARKATGFQAQSGGAGTPAG